MVSFLECCLIQLLPRFYTAGTDKEQTEITAALANSPEAIAKIGQFFHDTTRQLITASSFSLVGKKTHGVDVVRDVLKLVPIYWAAADIVSSLCSSHGSLSNMYFARLVSNSRPRITPMVTTLQLSCITSWATSTRKSSLTSCVTFTWFIIRFIFLEIEAAKVMILGAKVRTDIRNLLTHIKNHLHGHGGNRVCTSLLQKHYHLFTLYYRTLLLGLWARSTPCSRSPKRLNNTSLSNDLPTSGNREMSSLMPF